MTAKRTYNYEIMFLIGQAQAADLAAAIEHLKEIIVTRGHGEILAIKKWDERRLAYEIRGQKRGMYILCYFASPTNKLGDIERAFNLSEVVLRTLLVKADHLTVEEMKNVDGQADLTIEANLKAAAAAASAPLAAAPVAAAEPAAS